MVERLLGKQEIAGSIPAVSSMYDWMLNWLPTDPEVLKECLKNGYFYQPYIPLQITNVNDLSRRGSTVEHRFRKPGVEGSIPSDGSRGSKC